MYQTLAKWLHDVPKIGQMATWCTKHWPNGYKMNQRLAKWLHDVPNIGQMATWCTKHWPNDYMMYQTMAKWPHDVLNIGQMTNHYIWQTCSFIELSNILFNICKMFGFKCLATFRCQYYRHSTFCFIADWLSLKNKHYNLKTWNLTS